MCLTSDICTHSRKLGQECSCIFQKRAFCGSFHFCLEAALKHPSGTLPAACIEESETTREEQINKILRLRSYKGEENSKHHPSSPWGAGGYPQLSEASHDALLMGLASFPFPHHVSMVTSAECLVQLARHVRGDLGFPHRCHWSDQHRIGLAQSWV